MSPILADRLIAFGFDLATWGLNKLEAKRVTEGLRLQGKTDEEISAILDENSADLGKLIREEIARQRALGN